jgi:hypothetical protein
MTLLSVLRNGDSRFLPLLLSKVHDVLPTLANPMLQTVPDTPQTMCAEVDIFDGFGPIMAGLPSNFRGLSNNSSSEYKLPNSTIPMESSHGLSDRSSSDYQIPNPSIQRLEDVSSPIHGPESDDSSPFASPPILAPSMDGFPGLEYSSFPGMHRASSTSHGGNFGEGVGGGGRQMEFKREFDTGLGIGGLGSNPVRRPPLRQNSGSSFGMQIPRSVPEPFHHLQRHDSGENELLSPVNDSPFR